MHLVLTIQHYATPGCSATARHYRLIERWAERHRVTVVTSSAWRSTWQDRSAPVAPPGVTLVEVDVPYSNAMAPSERIRAFGRFSTLALRELLRIPRPDLMLGSSTPLSVPATVAAAAKIRRVPWVMEVRDLWPLFPIEMGAVPSRVYQRTLVGLEHRLYRSADHVVTLSPDMTAHTVRTGLDASRVTTSYNGTDLAEAHDSTDGDAHALRRAHDLPDGPIVLYAGTFGRANNLPLLIRIAEYLDAHVPGAALVCLGNGYGLPYLQAAAERLPSLRVVGPRPRTEIFRWFRLADLSVVAFNDLSVLGTNSPAKLFDSIASGTPVVVVNDGWMRSLVETEGCGFFASAAAPNAVAAEVVRLLRAPDERRRARAKGLALVAARPDVFDRRIIADRYEALFEQLVAGRSAEVTPGARLDALAASSA